MGYKLSVGQADRILQELKQNYRIVAPKRFSKRGWKPGTDMIRYAEINSISEIVHDEQSDFSPKDVIAPIVQTILHFTADEMRTSSIDDMGILLFARACDINGIRRLDKIYLENGGQADLYYQRMREKLKIVLLECREGWDTCFCVSMGANRTGDYSLAVRFIDDGLLVELKDADFASHFEKMPETKYFPEFVQSNEKKVILPEINNIHTLRQVHDLPMWAEYNDECISCGSCNTVCITCSCFDTIDVIYNETSRDGERRRVWSSCMLESFGTMAGGHAVRKTAGERMRFKVLHKVYDYRMRFGGNENMCVGCGRCDRRCPENISFSDSINKLSAAGEGEANQNG